MYWKYHLIKHNILVKKVNVKRSIDRTKDIINREVEEKKRHEEKRRKRHEKEEERNRKELLEKVDKEDEYKN